MHSKRFRTALGVFGVCALGLAAWFFGLATGSASGRAAQRSNAKVTIVTVSAGQPTELEFKLSKYSLLPSGPITFKVTNKGTVAHDFVIEGLPGSAGHGNLINGGQSTTMTVTIGPGSYSYECDFAGHAELGMAGNLAVQ